MAKLAPQGKFRALDSNGDPLDGGKLYTYESGTSTNKDTYMSADESSANTNPVILDSNGYASVWLGSGAYKFVLKDSDDVAQWSLDDIVGDATNAFGSSVDTISTNTTITSVYNNFVLLCTASLTLSLLDAATAGEGFYFTVKNTSASGTVTIDPDASETIDGAATGTIEAGKSALVICNGSSWQTLFVDSEFDITTLTDTAIVAADEIAFADVSDSNNMKKDTVQGIIDLIPQSDESTAGLVELATDAETTTGTSTTLATHPSGVKAAIDDSDRLLAMGLIDSTGTITFSFGLTSCTKSATGVYDLVLSTTPTNGVISTTAIHATVARFSIPAAVFSGANITVETFYVSSTGGSRTNYDTAFYFVVFEAG